MIEVTFACSADAVFLPEIERSADEAFGAVPNFAWITVHEAQSEQKYAELIELGFTWVARSSSEIVGFLAAQPLNDSLHIWQMSVHSSYQKKGIGRMLLTAALDAAKQVGCREATLTTFRGVAWNESFYKKCGFYTLESPDITTFLQNILDSEANSGLPLGKRCAMSRSLRKCDNR